MAKRRHVSRKSPKDGTKRHIDTSSPAKVVNGREAPTIEIAKALKTLRGVADRREYETIWSTLTQGRVRETERSLAGLTEEDEFALMCWLMQTASHIVPLEQRPLIRADYVIPDFLVRFVPGLWTHNRSAESCSGFKCLVEVKSTKNRDFKIGGADLARRRNFADTFGFPLLFAVRFLEFGTSALWVIVEDADREKKSLRVSIDDWLSGLRPILWNEPGYSLAPGTYFQVSYSESTLDENVRHMKYGTQVCFQIARGSDRVGFEGIDAIAYSAFFEAFGLKEHLVERRGDRTEVLYVPELSCCSLVDVFYRMNHLPVDDNGRSTYDASRILVDIATGDAPGIVTRNFVEMLLGPLVEQKFVFLLGYGSLEDNHKKWRMICGSEQE